MDELKLEWMQNYKSFLCVNQSFEVSLFFHIFVGLPVKFFAVNSEILLGRNETLNKVLLYTLTKKKWNWWPT